MVRRLLAALGMHRTLFVRPALVLVGSTAIWACSGSPSTPSVAVRASAVKSASTAHKTDDGNPSAMPPQPAMISIVSSYGTGAFNPNPTQITMGNTIVWQNSDLTLHHIMLDDGTDVGDVMPGQSTMPTTLNREGAVGYWCTIHPSMVGVINGDLTNNLPQPVPYPMPPSGGGYNPPGYGPPADGGYGPPPDYNYGYRVGRNAR